MTVKKIGKIKSVSFGMGGYDGVMLGISFEFGSDKDRWGVCDFKGTWASDPSKHAEWTKKEQTVLWGEMVRFIGQLLKEANVSDINDLKDIPVEVELEGNSLKRWRILTEVI